MRVCVFVKFETMLFSSSNVSSIILSNFRFNSLSFILFIQEFHVSQTYHEGLLKLQAKEYEKARELLQSVLRDPLIANAQVLLYSLFVN